MEIDKRCLDILTAVSNNNFITSREIKKQLSLSRNQFDYSMNQLNDWLEENNFPKIIRTKKGGLIVEEAVLNHFVKQREMQTKNYILAEKERLQKDLLLLLINLEYLSLDYFIEETEVSRNTVLADLKEVKKYVSSYDVKVIYSRKKGYYLSGDEWQIRKIISHLIEKIASESNGWRLLNSFIDKKGQDIERFQKGLVKIENQLGIQYSDYKIKIAPFIIYFILKRVQSGCVISDNSGAVIQDVQDTKEYEALHLLMGEKEFLLLPESERLYMTLYLLTMNITTYKKEPKLSSMELKKAIKDFLIGFEKKSAIQFTNREELEEKLFLHLKPAYFRIKYKLTTDYLVPTDVKNEFQTLYYLVEESLTPLQGFFGAPIPEKEIGFIVMFIGGYLINKERMKEKTSERPIIKAAIVCPNGVIGSKILEIQLQELFPSIQFYDVFSVREFQIKEIELTDVDIVFSTVQISSIHEVVIIDSYINRDNQEQVIKLVNQKLFRISNQDLMIEKIMKSVKKYAEVTLDNEIILRENIKNTMIRNLNGLVIREEKDHGKKDLAELLSPEFIKIENREMTWKEAIDQVSQPLLSMDIITKNYKESIQEMYETVTPNIMLGSQIAIPHGKPEDGTNKLGMSLLKVNTQMKNESSSVKFIVMIAPINRQDHLKAMFQLLKIAKDENVLQLLKHANSSKEIYQIIKKYQ